jgi:hypothetical protein
VQQAENLKQSGIEMAAAIPVKDIQGFSGR